MGKCWKGIRLAGKRKHVEPGFRKLQERLGQGPRWHLFDALRPAGCYCEARHNASLLHAVAERVR